MHKLALILLLFISSLAVAAPPPAIVNGSITAPPPQTNLPTPWWIGLSLGAPQMDIENNKNQTVIDLGVVFALDLHIQRTQHQLMAFRSVMTFGGNNTGSNQDVSTGVSALWQFAGMYGLINKGMNGFIDFTGGLSYNRLFASFAGTDNTGIKFVSSFGLPLQFDAVWTPGPNFGLGITELVDFNNIHTYNAIVLTMIIGDINPQLIR